MKTKHLFYMMVVSGLLFVISFLWLVVELNLAIFTDYEPYFYSVLSLVAFAGLSGWIGIVYSERVKNDPKKAVNEFKPKGMIILLLMGLSLTCNGQSRFENEFRKVADSLLSMRDNVISNIEDPTNLDSLFSEYIDTDFFINPALNVDTSSFIQFRVGDKWTPILKSNEDKSKIELVVVEVCTINLLLQYKNECFNDSTMHTIDKWVSDFSAKEHRLIEYDIDIPNKRTITIKEKRVDEYIWTHKTPTFEDFLNWIENRKNK